MHILEPTQVNLTQVIVETINNLFNNIFSSVDNSLYTILDDLLFIDKSIINDTNIYRFIGNFDSDGILLICNSLLLGFLLYYIVTLLLSYFTFSQIQKPYQFIIKLFLCAVFMNSSIFILEKFITLFSTISSFIRQVGENIIGESICLSKFIENINSNIFIDNNLNIFSFDGIIKSFTTIGLLNLAISYSIRYILIKVFILLAPFAIISLLNSTTSWFFKSWIRLFFSLLFLQIFVSLILLISFSLKINNSDIFSKIIYIGSIYTLIKANTFARDFIGGFSTTANNTFSGFTRSFLTKS